MNRSTVRKHLELYREQEERLAAEEKERAQREEAEFRQRCEEAQRVLKETAAPMLEALSRQLMEYDYPSRIHPVAESEQTTQRTRLKTTEYAMAIAVERPKGMLILRIVTSPQSRTISSMLGVPHGNCSSVFHAAGGPYSEAEEVIEKGIHDFMISAFPLAGKSAKF